jgi:chromosome segregation ATPase
MRNRLLLLIVFSTAPVFAQAPVEERSLRGDAFTEAQQRVDFARRTWEQSERRVKDAEQSLKEAEAAFSAMRSQYEQAKSQAEKAKKELGQARATVSESRKAYETESADFERLRRGDAGRGQKK